MCGICGEIRFDSEAVAHDSLSIMNAVMANRGPDDEGFLLQKRIGFGHRRLKIMDLSAHSHQPMTDAELGLSVVFNGALYNYRELRRELQARGYSFVSDGDTEVLIKAYHAWGASAVHRFKGMFAFALWEHATGRVFLARDRFGIKPLYYTLDDNRLRFASSLPALLAAGEIDTNIDPVGLNHYLNFHAVIPPPHTIIRGIKKFPQGSYGYVEINGELQIEAYWQPHFLRSPEDETCSLDVWQARVTEALQQAVRRRLVAAVDVGVLLSGGVDSSLLVGLMAAEGCRHIKTYSVGFESIGQEVGDEFIYSDLIAEHFGTDHQKILIDSRELRDTLPAAIAAMSEPMVSHDCVAFYLLSREVSKTCKVVQSGQGADEVFAGYHWYQGLQTSRSALHDYRRLFFDRTHQEYLQTVTPAYAVEDVSTAYVKAYFDGLAPLDAVDKALAIDSHVMLVDDPVKRVDNMTMAWGLEARVPFLDHELVALVQRIPSRFKTASGGKHILKQLARDFIPAAVIDRPKGYFPVPALKYLRGEFLQWVREALTSPRARQRNLFQPEYVERLLASPEQHLTPLNGSKLWQLGVLELWLQTHGL